MSKRPPLTFDPSIQAALTQYATDLFVDEWPVQQQINQEALQQGMPQIELRPHEGWLVYFLARLIKIERAVEIGTLAGYSASWILRALPEHGKLYTLEANPHHAEVAQVNFENLGMTHKVEMRLGMATDTLKNLNEIVDLVFIDADKESYPAYLEWSVEHVRSGGLILAHNAFRGGDILKPLDEHSDARRPSMEGIHIFNRQIAADSRLTGIIIPDGDGLLAAMVN